MIVVGGGIYGCSVARRAAELGARVTVIDPRPDDAEERGSGGITRLLRLEYGDKALYSRLTLAARDAWRALEAGVGVELYREVGAIFIVPHGDSGAWEEASLAATEAIGRGGVRLDPREIAARFPTIRTDGIDWALFNPVGGFLWAHRATRVMWRRAMDAGVTFVPASAKEVVRDGVRLGDGAEIAADVVVIATGSWTRTLAPMVAIRPSRQVVAYVRGGPRDFPIFGEGAPFAIYGTPPHDGYGAKIGSHDTGPDRDPDDPRERIVTEDDLAGIREYARRRFGLLGADAEITRADVCFYAMTPDEDPLIDWLPGGCFMCSGFSGHGFKFAPIVAAAAAEKALGMSPALDISAFAWRPAVAVPPDGWSEAGG
jgi:sarcosine oxidase subunit beta